MTLSILSVINPPPMTPPQRTLTPGPRMEIQELLCYLGLAVNRLQLPLDFQVAQLLGLQQEIRLQLAHHRPVPGAGSTAGVAVHILAISCQQFAQLLGCPHWLHHGYYLRIINDN